MRIETEQINTFEHELILSEGKLPLKKAIKLFEAMWNEGVKLGVLPTQDPMEGIETDIKVARVLNSCSKNSSPK
jgi:hypothetical protein